MVSGWDRGEHSGVGGRGCMVWISQWHQGGKAVFPVGSSRRAEKGRWRVRLGSSQQSKSRVRLFVILAYKPRNTFTRTVYNGTVYNN